LIHRRFSETKSNQSNSLLSLWKIEAFCMSKTLITLVFAAIITRRARGFLLPKGTSFSLFGQRGKQPKTAVFMSSSTPSLSNPMDQFGLPTPLLLGSASFTRKLILKEMGVKYKIVVRPIDEKGIGDREKDEPSDLVLRLGTAKMNHLVNEIKAGRCDDDLPDASHKNYIVLTGDQVVTCNGKILEKPESVDEARSFVSAYGTHPPSTVGSCILTHLETGIQVSGVDTATIHFQSDIGAAASLIDDLLADDAPVLSCAGGLMVEHPLVKKYIVRIDGTEDSVMGLSKDLVLRLMEELSKKIAHR